MCMCVSVCVCVCVCVCMSVGGRAHISLLLASAFFYSMTTKLMFSDGYVKKTWTIIINEGVVYCLFSVLSHRLKSNGLKNIWGKRSEHLRYDLNVDVLTDYIIAKLLHACLLS